MSRVHFYATAKDLKYICQIIDEKFDLQIYKDFEVLKEEYTGELVKYDCLSDIPDLGFAQNHQRVMCQSYTLADDSTIISPMTRRGPSKDRVYMRATINEVAVEFRPAGELQDGSIIMGEIMSHMPSKKARGSLALSELPCRNTLVRKYAVGHGLAPAL